MSKVNQNPFFKKGSHDAKGGKPKAKQESPEAEALYNRGYSSVEYRKDPRVTPSGAPAGRPSHMPEFSAATDTYKLKGSGGDIGASFRRFKGED